MNNAPPPLPPVATPAPGSRQNLAVGRVRPGPIIRDGIIIFVLTAIGGFVAGLATGGASRDAHRSMLAIAASNPLFGTVGFTISGCLAPSSRWRHLACMAAGVWLASLINVLLFDVSLLQWIGGAILTTLIMGIGGALSYIFRRDE